MGKKKPGRRTNAKGRSLGEARHVRLYLWLLKSTAYQALDCTARTLLVEFYALYNGMNNGELFLSVREAARRLGVAPNTALKAIRQLEAKGFIRPNQRGSFDWKGGAATSWILTEYEHAGQLATKDFMRWERDGENRKPVSPIATIGIKQCDHEPKNPVRLVRDRLNF